MSEVGKIAEKYRHMVGVEHIFTAPEEVGRGIIRMFSLAIDDPNPLYLNPAEAEKSVYGGLVAPPTLICETFQYYTGSVDDEGSYADRVRLPLGQEIRASNDYVFHRMVRHDDIVTARWKISDIYEREGRTGHLLFLLIDISYTNQRGELLAENKETMVNRLSPSPESGRAER